MAKVHESANLSGAANAAALGTLIAEAIRDELSAHAAWELVEEWNPGSTVQWYIFKNLSSVSGFPNDFYVIMCRIKATGVLQFMLAEGFNAGTRVASLFTCNNGAASATNTYTYDSSGRQTSNTYTLTNAAISTTANLPKYHKIVPTGTSINYNMVTYDDGFVFLTTGGFNQWLYFGAYEWMGVPSNAMPIHHQGTDADISSPCGVTRNPLVAGATAGHYALSTINRPGASDSQYEQLGYPGDPDWKDGMQGGYSPCAEYMLFINANLSGGAAHVNSPELIGYIIGKMKYMRFMQGQPSGLAFGDSYKIDGTLWVPHVFTAGVVKLFDTGVAY